MNKLTKDQLAVALAGSITGALAEAIGEMGKELRRYAGSDFDKCLDALEAKAIRSVKNAPLDGVAEKDQLFIIEQTRNIVAAKFKDIRDGT